MSKIEHNNNSREYDICLLERKWWAIDEMLIAFNEDELSDRIYDKLYEERNKIEDLMPKLKPTTPGEIAAKLRLTKKIHSVIWGPGRGEEPCSVSKNLYDSLDGIIEMLEQLETGQATPLLSTNNVKEPAS